MEEMLENNDEVMFEENDSSEECTDLALGYDPERWQEYDADAAHRKDFCKGFATAGGAAALIGLMALIVRKKLKKKKSTVTQTAAKTPIEAAEEMRRRTATVVESDFNEEEYEFEESEETD